VHDQILATYQEERFPVAARLLSFDERICRSICTVMDDGVRGKLSYYYQELESILEEENSSASGLSVQYKSNLLMTAAEHSEPVCHPLMLPMSKQGLAKNIPLGARFPNEQVVSQSDARPCQLQEQLISSGQWHLLVFAGNITNEVQAIRLQQFACLLCRPDSHVQKLVHHARESLVGSLGVYLVHSAPRDRVEMADLPEAFMPFDPSMGYDYTKVFADVKSHRGNGGTAYKSYGIGSDGCIVLVRPDQHTAFIGGLSDVDEMNHFFARFSLLQQKTIQRHTIVMYLMFM
jgi:phenol 2-monooxygenase